MNDAPLLTEANSMMNTLREHGLVGDAYTMRAPRPYAEALIDELKALGVEDLDPADRVVNIEFSSGERLIIEIE